MLGRKNHFQNVMFQKLNKDIHTFASKNSHMHHHLQHHMSHREKPEEPKKSQYEK